jgi:RNA polymerase sigma-70 factor (ECF subfamily)
VNPVTSPDDATFTQWLGEADRSFTECVRGNVDVERALVKVRWRAVTRQLDEPKGGNHVAGDELSEIVAEARTGERYAVERLLATVGPMVVRYCRAKVGRQVRGFTSADDVAQEVCIAVFRALPNYRDQGDSFLAFVYGLARHKVVDAHRAAARDLSVPVADTPEERDSDSGPERRVLHEELNGRLGRLLNELPDRQREIVLLRVIVGLSAEETAAAVGSTPGAVRVAQHRALAKLRGMITDEREE